MPDRGLSRRRFLISAGIAALATPILAACGGGQPASPTASASGAAGAKPAATQQVASQPASGARVPLSISAWTFADRPWQKERAEKYGKDNAAKVDLKVEDVIYDEMSKKQLAWAATGTAPDIIYSGVKWAAYSAYKGVFFALDDLVKADDPGMDDFFKGAIQGATLDGKLFALPFEVNTGNVNVIGFNQDMLDEKGIKPPTDDWTLEDYASMAAKLTDRDKKIFGTNYLTTNYYDFGALARSYGGDILSEDGKEFTLTTDPKTVEAARFHTELRTRLKAAPMREESQGIAFPAGQIALNASGVQSLGGLKKTIADKFKWDAVLLGTGPGGLRGYEMFVTMYSISAKTKDPKAAYDLLKYMTSKETAMYAFVEQGQPPARASVWNSPEADKIHPIWGRAAKWLSNGKDKGPFPMPNNLRFQELQDKWANLSLQMFYGDVGLDEGMKKIQDECQAIVKMARG